MEPAFGDGLQENGARIGVIFTLP